MIYSVIGLFKKEGPPHDAGFEAEVSEQLAQPFRRIVNAGYLRDPDGARIGLLALIDVGTFAEAQSFLEASPYHRGGHFESARVAQYDVEIGRLD
ncbi:MAG TPA: hypothetical protein VIE16_11345 [Phenylobacterium sp.]|jgi:uncharacterized protein YciI